MADRNAKANPMSAYGTQGMTAQNMTAAWQGPCQDAAAEMPKLEQVAEVSSHTEQRLSEALERLESLASRLVGGPPPSPGTGSVHPVRMGQIGSMHDLAEKLRDLADAIVRQISDLERI